jgi:carboxymethylenebutenolidase
VRIPALRVLALCLLLAACGESESALDRVAAEHEGDRGDVPGAAAPAATATPSAGAAPAEAEPVAVATESVEYAQVEGRPVRGFFARPARDAGGLPAVIVIHEWWGLNDNIREMTRRLAAEGYAALAVDLYEGVTAAVAPEARSLASAAMSRGPALEANLLQAHAWLAARGAPRVGVLGWCFGGGWSLRTALLLPDAIGATVVYYGQVETDPERLAPLRGPVLGIFGELDGSIPVASVRAFESALERAGVPHEVHVYEGVGHAFANPSGLSYAPEAAQGAWQRTLAFLSAHLRGDVP